MSNQTKYNPPPPPQSAFSSSLKTVYHLGWSPVSPVSLKYSHQTVLWQKINRDKINSPVPSREEAENICAPLTAEGTNLQEEYQRNATRINTHVWDFYWDKVEETNQEKLLFWTRMRLMLFPHIVGIISHTEQQWLCSIKLL